MDLFDLVAKISLDTKEYESGLDKASGEAKSAASGMASKIGSAVKTIGKIGIAAGAAAGTAVAVLSKSSVSAFADYEQLVGGVETLFGKSASIAEGYASTAYQTAGLSANAYMETVTSFSASLLQGLGGNTKQAAEMANTAVTDMSDNANKMGTSMQSIQDAYQGFAKQNYTMLDNLKLGYGGTQEEMIRLINDSGTLNEKIDSLDGITFDQIITAIHAVQENMGITGTTAKEASTTIEGSWNSLKGAWENLMTGMADGTQDLPSLLDQVLQSADTFGGNLIPRIQTTMESAGEAVSYLAPVIVEKLPEVASQVVPGFVSAAGSMISSFGSAILSQAPTIVGGAVELVNNFASGIPQGLPALLAQVLPMILSFSEGLRSNAGQLVDAGMNLLLSLAEGIANSIPTLIAYIPQIVTNIAGVINDNAPKLLITAGAMILTLGRGLIQAIPTLIQNIPQIIQAIVSVWTAFNWLNLGKTVVTKIKSGIKALPNAVKTVSKKAIDAIKNLFKSGATAVKNLAKGMGNGVKNALKSAFTSAVNTVKSKLSAMKSSVSSIFSSIKSAISSKINAAKSVVTSAISKIKSAFHFSWSLPHLKLPHISISGKFSINPPSAPHFGISWYRKAMENAYLLNGATIFGASGGSLLGGGEAGAEMIIGRDRLMNMISDAAGENNDEKLDSVLALLAESVRLLKLGGKLELDGREVGRMVRRYA